jgi:hypothetical protein
MSRNTLATHLQRERSIREMPSETALSSILSKNVQVEQVGSEIVEKADGTRTRHAIFDIKRGLIQEHADLLYTRPPSCMTSGEKKKAQRCSVCGRTRVFRTSSEVCLHCERGV